jgi:multiple sugar transport system substrate-binding protein
VKEAALDFAAFMARPELVRQLAVTGGTGINPSRFSQLDDVEPWIEAGFDRESAADYLDAILQGINHPNAVLDLRIRGSAEYFQTLDAEISRALVGELTPQQALDNVAALWNEITERYGRDAQLEQFRASVGF